MRRIILLFISIAICFFISCNSKENDKKEIEIKITPDSVSTAISADSTKTIVNRSMIWNVELQPGQKEKLRAPENSKLDTFSSRHLIDLINANFQDIHLDLVKVSHDTIYVMIPNSKKLTQEIGNTGADNYLASTTFTLTELKDIKYVNIAMKAGDHAEPGVYSRADFKKLR